MMNDDKISKETIMTYGDRHEYENVFSYKTLEYLFECRADKPNILKRKESAELEVKANFNWGDKAKYGKLFCSLANNKGGYVIFGIKDKPHELVGLRSDNFSRKDPAKITEYLNSRFSPTIEWEPCDHEIDGKNFGIIYIYSSKEKPVMCINNDTDVIKEGEIFYRYSGETKIIRATDLQKIINERIEAEKKSWQDMIFRLAKDSPNNLALLNLNEGTLEEGGTKVLIDEDLLSKLKFIKEGKFVEEGGVPTLRLLGDVQPISGAILPTKEVPSRIPKGDICKAFFDGECDYPLEYLEGLADQRVRLLPLWFFVKKSGKSVESIIEILENLRDPIHQTRAKIIERLKYDREENYKVGKVISDIKIEEGVELRDIDEICDAYIKDRSLKSNQFEIVKRSVFLNLLCNNPQKLVDDLDELKSDLVRIIEAITHIPAEKIKEHKLVYLNLLNRLYDMNLEANISSVFRKAVCSVDLKLYNNGSRYRFKR